MVAVSYADVAGPIVFENDDDARLVLGVHYSNRCAYFAGAIEVLDHEGKKIESVLIAAPKNSTGPYCWVNVAPGIRGLRGFPNGFTVKINVDKLILKKEAVR